MNTKPLNTEKLIARPNEHPFAPFVRILGKGKSGSRSLTREEAAVAMSMILRGEVKDTQLGAFLMLLRVKEESADELTGFVEAARAEINPPGNLNIDLDWSSYAGKRKHLPWFLLSAFALADRGVRVFMHGSGGHTTGRLYTEAVLTALGIKTAASWNDALHAIDESNFTFMSLRHICPPLQAMIDLRNEFGLRSPVHTLARLLNPLRAPHSIQSVFHPPYALRHQQAAVDLGQMHASVFKGEGGEVERKPEALTKVYSVHEGVLSEEAWPKLIEGRQEQSEEFTLEHLRGIWRGDVSDDYAELAVIGTLAIALKLLQRAPNPEQALTLARNYWQQRNRERLN